MLFNVKHETFTAVGGSFACDSLPTELKKEYEQGMRISSWNFIIVGSSNFWYAHQLGIIFNYSMYKTWWNT